MAYVYVFIAVGAAVFFIMIVLDYLNVFSALKPKADLARQEIRECEMQIEGEKAVINTIKQEVEELQQEIVELEKQLAEIGKIVEGHRKRESRRKPTKFKLNE